MRTPLLIHWPGHSKPGMSSDALVAGMDFYPTLMEMAGLPQKPEQHVDGTSIAGLFEGKDLNRDTLIWHFPHYQGEGSYPASAIRVGDYKLVHNYHHDDVLLFNIADDPYETKNIATSMPERAEALDRQLMEYLQEAGAYVPQPTTPEQLAKSPQGKKKARKRIRSEQPSDTADREEEQGKKSN